MPGPRRLATGALLISPALVLSVLAYAEGGYFPAEPAIATLAVLTAVAIRLVASKRPLAGRSTPAMLMATALGCFAIWTLISSGWSHAPARAQLEYGRTLLYLATFAALAMIGRSSRHIRTFTAALALAALIVSVGALCVYLLPRTFPVSDVFERRRMSWPTSYWNTTGLIAALGAPWALHLAGSKEPLVVRLVASAALPAFAAVVVLTASRGALMAAAIGIACFLALSRTRGVLLACIFALAPVVVSARAASGAHGLDQRLGDLTAYGLHEGRTAATAIGGCMVVAAMLQLLAIPVQRRFERVVLPHPSRGLRRIVVLLSIVLVGAAAVGVGAPGRLSSAYEQFVASDPVVSESLADRVTDFSSNGRLRQWAVAIDYGFKRHPMRGTGAGTYALLWQHHRTTTFNILDAHSLYAEQLGELGIIGAALLFSALLAGVLLLVRRALVERRATSAWAALAGAALGWLAFAAVDWSWEMPAVTCWMFGAFGLAAAGLSEYQVGARVARRDVLFRSGGVLVVVSLCILPLRIERSQRALEATTAALEAGNCRAAVLDARRSTSELSTRPEPLEALAFCEAAAGRAAVARAAVDQALARDPGDWELHYTAALVSASAGDDPRREARDALMLNPMSELARTANARFGSSSRRRWTSVARDLPLPLPIRGCGGAVSSTQTPCGAPRLPREGASRPRRR